jgi:hypothetical protein
MKAFLRILLLQLNLVVSKFMGPLQNFELLEIRLKGSKGLSKMRFVYYGVNSYFEKSEI